MFIHPGDSHNHSLQTLNTLYEYDDFMGSIDSLIDLGCGSGDDLEWWATRTTRDDVPEPLNIKCMGIDQFKTLELAKKYPNVRYQMADFEQPMSLQNQKFDVLWSHDSFQYCVNPLNTLANWNRIASDGSMLCLILPQTTNLHLKQQHFILQNGCYYHHTLVSLIYMLATTGWDCSSGFFLKRPNDTWLHAIVYKSSHEPMDPKTTSWHTLSEKGLLPESAAKSVYSHGHLRQQDLMLPWIDRSLTWMGQQ